jgi:transposase-like protein
MHSKRANASSHGRRAVKGGGRRTPLPDLSSRGGTRRRTLAGVACPRCGALAIYRYGRTPAGDKRYLCQACRRQFTLKASVWLSAEERPACPACGKPMHVYMREGGLTRFRCRDYPACRTFFKRHPQEG